MLRPYTTPHPSVHVRVCPCSSVAKNNKRPTYTGSPARGQSASPPLVITARLVRDFRLLLIISPPQNHDAFSFSTKNVEKVKILLTNPAFLKKRTLNFLSRFQRN
jgi:hypothetical protein